MKTAADFRKELTDVYDDLRAGKIGRRDVEIISNLAGLIISSAKTQIDYFALTKRNPGVNIAFLNELDATQKPNIAFLNEPDGFLPDAPEV